MGIQQGQRILEEASWNVYCGSLLMVKKYAPIIYVIYAIIQYRLHQVPENLQAHPNTATEIHGRVSFHCVSCVLTLNPPSRNWQPSPLLPRVRLRLYTLQRATHVLP